LQARLTLESSPAKPSKKSSVHSILPIMEVSFFYSGKSMSGYIIKPAQKQIGQAFGGA
jgi:hypothetical protein